MTVAAPVLNGSGSTSYGSEQVTLAKEDFLYIPATVPHALRNDGSAPITVAISTSSRLPSAKSTRRKSRTG